MLEASLMMSKSNRSNSKERIINDSLKRSSSQEVPLKYSTNPQNGDNKDKLSKNEKLLLEKILEKDDEIKELRNKLDVFQYSNRLNYTHQCKIGFV